MRRVECPYRQGDGTTAVCGPANHEVHERLCLACLEASCGKPDPDNPNWFNGSALVEGFAKGRHDNVERFEKATAAVLAGQREWVKTAPASPRNDPEPETARCSFLGRAVAHRGCGCWRKSTYVCKAKEGLHVIPDKDCPCPLYEGE